MSFNVGWMLNWLKVQYAFLFPFVLSGIQSIRRIVGFCLVIPSQAVVA